MVWQKKQKKSSLVSASSLGFAAHEYHFRKWQRKRWSSVYNCNVKYSVVAAQNMTLECGEGKTRTERVPVKVSSGVIADG